MRGVSGFLFIFAVGMVLNAGDGKWAFDRNQSGGDWVALDLVIAAGLLVGSWLLWRAAKRP